MATTINTGEQEVTIDPRAGAGLKAPRGAKVTFVQASPLPKLTFIKVSDEAGSATDWVPASSGDSYDGLLFQLHVDNDAGLDNQDGSALTPIKTLEEAFARIPRDGHGGSLKLLCKPRAGGAQYLDKLGAPDSLRFDRLTGYDLHMVRGSDLSDDASDHATAGGQQIFGPFTVDAAPAPDITEWEVTAPLPAEASILGKRVRFTSGPLSGQSSNIYKTDGASHLFIGVNDTGTPPNAGDTFVIEQPGFYVEEVRLPGNQNFVGVGILYDGLSTADPDYIALPDPHAGVSVADVTLAFVEQSGVPGFQTFLNGGTRLTANGRYTDPLIPIDADAGTGLSTPVGSTVTDIDSVSVRASYNLASFFRCGIVDGLEGVVAGSFSFEDCRRIGIGGSPTAGSSRQPPRGLAAGDQFIFNRCAQIDVAGARLDVPSPGGANGFRLVNCGRVYIDPTLVFGTDERIPALVIIDSGESPGAPTTLAFRGTTTALVPPPDPTGFLAVTVLEGGGYQPDIYNVYGFAFSDLGVSPVRTPAGNWIGLSSGFVDPPPDNYNGENVGEVVRTAGFLVAPVAYPAFRVLSNSATPVVAGSATTSNQFGVSLLASRDTGGGGSGVPSVQDSALVVCKGPAWIKTSVAFTPTGQPVYAAAGGEVTATAPSSALTHTQVGRAIARKTVGGTDYVLVDVSFVQIPGVPVAVVNHLEQNLTNNTAEPTAIGDIVVFDTTTNNRFAYAQFGAFNLADPDNDAFVRQVGVAAAVIGAGSIGRIITHGQATVRMVAGLTLVQGDTLYISEEFVALYGNIRATNKPPLGWWSIPIGNVEDTSTYTGLDGEAVRVKLMPDAHARRFGRETSNRVETTDATPTDILDIVCGIPDTGTQYYTNCSFDVEILAMGNHNLRGRWRRIVDTFDNGTTTFLDLVTELRTFTTAALAIAFVVTPQHLFIRVTGIVGEDIDWVVTVRLLSAQRLAEEIPV